MGKVFLVTLGSKVMTGRWNSRQKKPSKLKEFPQTRRGSASSVDPFVITYDYKSILPSNVILFENRKGVTTQIEFF